MNNFFICFLLVAERGWFLYNTLMINENEKQKKWLVAVSGGADSMALLDQCVTQHIDVMVAHMNYQKRESATRDMEGVQTYCKEHHIPCIVRFQEEDCVGNFQAFARTQRYRFFKELIEKHHLHGVFVAHQLDDHLETYLMQKQRGSTPEYYGIQRCVTLFGCHVVRPLLEYTKADLEHYCEEHHVKYYLDESNLENHYTRNRIRHQIIEKMSKEEKVALSKEIAKANEELLELRTQADIFLQTWNYDRESISKLPDAVACHVLRKWIYQQCKQHVSEKEEKNLLQLLRQSITWNRPLPSGLQLSHAYGQLSMEKVQDISYEYRYDEVTYETTPYFTCAKQGSGVEAVTLSKDDFPIFIRSPKPQDAIALRFGTKKLNRWFIDRKIPPQNRKIWPVVVNRHGKIVLVPKIGCDISHFSNNPNLFVLK